MALDRSCVGLATEPVGFSYTWKDVVLYALAVGATADELDYLYEKRGPKVLPSFAVIPAFAPLREAMGHAGVSFDNVVHGHQKVTLHAPLPPEGTLSTRARVEAIYDMKKMAQVVVRTETHDRHGRALFDTEWGVLVLGEGGWGGEAPPGRDGAAPNRPPDFSIEEKTSAQQALLYRLLGDGNPLHVDPDFPLVQERFGGRPILHGLCTFGFMVRALARAACDGDAGRIRRIAARFSKPVWPGDTLVTDVWRDGPALRLRTTTRERGDAVLSHGVAEVDGTPPNEIRMPPNNPSENDA